MIRVLCAPNAFKGTLTAFDAAAAMATGARAAGADAAERPVADGGDGTLEVLIAAAGAAGRVSWHQVAGPLGGSTRARLGWIEPEHAVLELADAAGLRTVRARLDPMAASTHGVGELVAVALEAGARSLTIGLGGSATTDGGAGIIQALGGRLLDALGRELDPGGGALASLEHIDLSGLRSDLARCRLEVAVDVRSPLYGPDGAAEVFAPQKGASPAEVALLDAALRRLAGVAERDLGARGLAERPGAGAAGGAGFGLALLGASLRPGAALVCDRIGIDASIAGADAVVTGEGRLDSQTPAGKAPSEVAARARRHGVACVAVAGVVDDPLSGVFDAVYSLTDLAGGRDPFTATAELLEEATRLAVINLRSR